MRSVFILFIFSLFAVCTDFYSYLFTSHFESFLFRIVKDKYIVTCHRIEGKIIVKVWNLQLALLSQSVTDGEQQETDGIAMAPLLIQMQFEEPDPHPLRIWSMNADELQIFLSSEIKEESNEQRVKFIAILNFV